MEFLIITIGIAFVSWLIGVITEKSIFRIVAAICLAGAVIFLACLVGFIPI